MAVKGIPEGTHTGTPYLLVNGAGKLIDFLVKGFDGKEHYRMNGPDGKVMHAQVQIGDSKVMLGDVMGPYEPIPTMLYLYTPDMQRWFDQAVAAGAEVLHKPADQFYGDRAGAVKDPTG